MSTVMLARLSSHMGFRTLVVLVLVGLTGATLDAQFRRGMFGESHEVVVFPVEPPVTLLPAGTVEISVRNTTTASARLVERLQERLGRQLTDNDSRLRVVPKDGDFTIVATLTEWTESRRNSTKYVSERRQVGTREVTDKNGKKKQEPVYSTGENKPSVVISGAAGIRIEVRPRTGGSTVLADESVRHALFEEHLTEAGPPARDVVEDALVDTVVGKAAGRISPGRQPARVLLGRSEEVDKLNALAQNRRWQDWLSALEALKPHRDRKRDAYRLHNLAVAQEAIAYEAAATEDSLARLAAAETLIAQAAQQHPDEKYIRESADRIAKSRSSYQQVGNLYRQAALQNIGPARTTTAPTAAADSSLAAPASGTSGSRGAAITNKDVIDLRAAGLDDDNLIATINDASAVKFDLTPAGLKALLSGKISNRVISAMRERSR